MIDALHIAGQRGATTIAVTNFNRSPLALACDVLLTTAARETTFRSGSMASRIAQLSLIECLYAAVAHRSHPEAVRALESLFSVVNSRHLRTPAQLS